MYFWTKRRRRYAVLIGLSLALILGLIIEANPQQLAYELAHADLSLVALAVVLFILTIAMRALRWHLLLMASDQHVRPRSTLSQYAVAQALNDLTPVKVVGEGARVVGINREEGVPIGTGLATVVTEKIMDLVLVTSVLVISIVLLYPDVAFRPWTSLAIIVGLVIAANLTVIAVLRRPDIVEKVGKLITWFTGRSSKKWARDVEVSVDESVRSFNSALQSTHRINRRLWLMAGVLTLPIWGLEFARLALIMASLGAFASLPAVVIASTLAITFQVFLPAGSGNVVVIADVFANMGIALATATAAGLLSVATSIWISVPVALIAIALYGFPSGSLEKEIEISEQASERSEQPEHR
jgi:uncharacterized protein (TIRG00374 family)